MTCDMTIYMIGIPWLIEEVWRIYAPVHHIIIGSDNGLSPFHRQAIIRVNDGLFSIGHIETYFSLILNQNTTIFVEENMMTSSNGNIFRVTGHLCGEFTGLRWIPRTKASDAGLWCFLWSASE